MDIVAVDLQIPHNSTFSLVLFHIKLKKLKLDFR